MATAAEWTVGYARQAEADFRTWETFQDSAAVPECHRLLFLQMACEKLTKAHLCDEGTAPELLQTSHAYTAKTLPVILRQQIDHSGLNRRTAGWVVAKSKPLAREIELLAPAVKRGGGRPDNCEYPWEDKAGTLHVPLDWTFVPTQLLTAGAGRTILKLIRDAIDRFLG